VGSSAGVHASACDSNEGVRAGVVMAVAAAAKPKTQRMIEQPVSYVVRPPSYSMLYVGERMDGVVAGGGGGGDGGEATSGRRHMVEGVIWPPSPPPPKPHKQMASRWPMQQTVPVTVGGGEAVVMHVGVGEYPSVKAATLDVKVSARRTRNKLRRLEDSE